MLFTNKKDARRLATLSAAAIAALVLAGCAATPSGDSSNSASAGGCGDAPAFTAPQDPDGVLAKLPTDVQKVYDGFGYPVLASKWSDLKAGAEPYKVAGSLPAIYNAYMNNGVTILNVANGKYAAEGVTDKDFTVAILPDPATMSPADQIKQYNQLVDDGVKGILLAPLSGDAMADAVTAAGEKGVITVTVSSTYVPSPYAINVMLNQNQAVAQTTGPILKSIGGKGNVVVVRGLPGESSDVQGYKVFTDMLKSCPNVSILGEVTGNYSNALAKTALLQLLSSNPKQVDMVWQTAAMGPGIISAFKDSGRDVPPIDFVGLQAGDAAWWVDAVKNGYSSTGSLQTADQTFNLGFDVLVRTLQGEGPLVNTLVFAPPIVTDKTVADVTVKGADLNSSDEAKAGADLVATKADIDKYFANPAK